MTNLQQKIITIVGKTNTGKSTLFNELINKKYSIITKKKNTTIECVFYGLKEQKTVIIDTPGPIIKKTSKNMNKIICDSILKSSLILILINNLNLETEDHFILELINKYKKKYILLINKIDKLKKKDIILPFIKNLNEKYKTISQIIPVSIKKNINIPELKTQIKIDNTTACKYFNNKDFKKLNYKSLIKNIIRETLLIKLQKEIPYLTQINIPNTILTKDTTHIIAELNVVKKSHKKIIIGEHGKKIKDIIYNIEKNIKKFCHKLQNVKIIIKISE